jgi:hypothetical protein
LKVQIPLSSIDTVVISSEEASLIALHLKDKPDVLLELPTERPNLIANLVAPFE